MTTKYNKNNEVTVKMTAEQFEMMVFIFNQVRMNADFSKSHYQSEVCLSEKESDIFDGMRF